MCVLIRTVREDDASVIVALLNPIIEAGCYTSLETPFSENDQLEFIRAFPERGVYHVAICSETGRIVAIQDVLPTISESGVFMHVGEISTFVALGSHRLGIGRSLCQATFAAAKTRGYKRIRATIRADNAQAVSFYLKQGFRMLDSASESVTVRGKYSDKILAEILLQ